MGKICRIVLVAALFLCIRSENALARKPVPTPAPAKYELALVLSGVGVLPLGYLENPI